MADDILDRLDATIRARRGADADSSYTASLFAKGRTRIAQKLGEEAVETVIAATAQPDRIASEAADLLFHLLVLLADAGLSLDDVRAELARREGLSGHTEKASRAAPLPGGNAASLPGGNAAPLPVSGDTAPPPRREEGLPLPSPADEGP